MEFWDGVLGRSSGTEFWDGVLERSSEPLLYDDRNHYDRDMFIFITV